MKNKPTGDVTFLFTDIEGSTKLAQTYPETLQTSLDIHKVIIQNAVESNNGFVFENVGDAFCCAFEKADDAVNAAVDSQINLANEQWKDAVIKVRMGIHSGYSEWHDKSYMGYITLARTARIMSSAHGGQIILSQRVIDDIKTGNKLLYSVRDMGERKLKDLIRPEHLYQLVINNLPSEFPPLKTLDARQNNLPFVSTSFIGREKELKCIKSLLSENRLLTLLGTGGTGKTRLSLQTGYDVIDDFTHGVWFVELAHLSDALYIPNEIAGVLNIKSDNNFKTIDMIISFLKEKETLLILDNCEHLIKGCAEITHKLLSLCPNLKILTTSRESLRIFEESTFLVHPLSLPELKNYSDYKSLANNDAVCLFSERAVSVKHEFRINDSNAVYVAKLCHNLDGIPLAIELAAARIKVLNVEQITEKINDRFNLLTTGSRTALPHHQTLKALIDWSYDLLSDKEKQLLQRLSVFSGGWTLEAAEEVCSDNDMQIESILVLLCNLVDKSLINSIESGGVTRYNMLETIRHYAAEKLLNKKEIYLKHLQYYLKLCNEKFGDESYDSLLRLRKIKNEFENIRAAINRNISSNSYETLKLVNEVGNAWDLNGNSSEGLEIYKKIFAMNIEINDEVMGSAFMYAGCLASVFSEDEISREYLNKAIKIFENLNDRSNIGFCLNYIGNIHFSKNEIQTSQKFHSKALMIGRDIDDKTLLALSLVDLATISRIYGDITTSRKQYEESLLLYRELDDKLSAAQVLIQLASIEVLEGYSKRARTYFEESLLIFKEYGNYIPLSIALLNLGSLSFSEKKYDEAELLFEECLSITKQCGYTNICIHALNKLAKSAFQRRKYSKVKSLLIHAIKICDTELDKLNLALNIEELGNCYFAMKKRRESALLFGISAAMNKINGYKSYDKKSGYNSALKKIKNRKDIKEFNSYFKKGIKINLLDAVKMIVDDELDIELK